MDPISAAGIGLSIAGIAFQYAYTTFFFFLVMISSLLSRSFVASGPEKKKKRARFVR